LNTTAGGKRQGSSGQNSEIAESREDKKNGTMNTGLCVSASSHKFCLIHTVM